MSRYVIVVESGADVPPERAKGLGIEIVPMHVAINGRTFDDGSIDSDELLAECERTDTISTTSAATPADFQAAFDRIHAKHPWAHILHLAYSAAPTTSYESALSAAEGRDYATSIDTKSVSGGQYYIASEVAHLLRENPEMPLDELKLEVESLIRHVRMGFIPGGLEFLKKGGRLSNAAYLGAQILRIKPVIEIEDGKLVATRKLRGGMHKVVADFIDDFLMREPLDMDRAVLIYNHGLDPEIRAQAEERLRIAGFQSFEWIKTGCVIASHCGPGSFGLVVEATEPEFTE